MSIERTCDHCAVVFQGRKNARFCSDHCRWLFHASKPEAQAKRKLSGKGCKDKGARVEREICHLIHEVTGDEVQRKLGQARDGGADADWGPFRLEIKARQTIAMPAWQEQVLKACEGTDMIPTVVWKRNGEEPWCAMPLTAMLSLFNSMRRALESLSQPVSSEKANE